MRLQGFDMGLDLDLGPELFGHRRLEAARDFVRGAEAKSAVHLEIEGYG